MSASESDPPRWAFEPMVIVEPDPGWAAAGARLAAALEAQLGPWVSTGVEHVGSTAIPGLAAKPILDVMAGVADFEPVPDIARALAPHGWHFVPFELDQRAWRRFFVQVQNDARVAHLHVIPAGEPRWSEQLRFRDRLRGDATLRDQYAALKRRLAREHAGDRETYSYAKAAFVYRVLDSAG